MTSFYGKKTKRPFRQGQTRWAAWMQLSKTNQPEMVPKAMLVVSCQWEPHADYPDIGHWITNVLVQGVQGPKGLVSVTIDMKMTDRAYLTYRQAKRATDEFNAMQQAHEKAQHEAAALGSIQETY